MHTLHKSQVIVTILLLIVSTTFGSGLGINISLPERGGTFVDIVKENYRWSEAGGGNDLTADQVDDHGWPEVDARFVLDYRPVAEWAGSIDDPEACHECGSLNLSQDPDVLDTWFSSWLWPFSTLGWPDKLRKWNTSIRPMCLSPLMISSSSG